MHAIESEGLIKDYRDARALDGLNLRVDEGEVYGFCGPNGAGKTTTLKILVGLVYPTSGSARVLGMDVVEDGVEVRRRIGYLPETYGLPERETVRSFLRYMGVLSGIPSHALDGAINERARQMGLERMMERRIRALSKGFRQKVGIAQALLHDPEILLFDEPTLGLDPIGRNEVLDTMKSVSSENRTVVFSTHILSDVERICDNIGIINQGVLVEEGDLEGLKAKHDAKDLNDVFLKVAGRGVETESG